MQDEKPSVMLLTFAEKDRFEILVLGKPVPVEEFCKTIENTGASHWTGVKKVHYLGYEEGKKG